MIKESIVYEAPAGQDVIRTAETIVCMAILTKTKVKAEFNGIWLKAEPLDSVATVLFQYCRVAGEQVKEEPAVFAQKTGISAYCSRYGRTFQ